MTEPFCRQTERYMAVNIPPFSTEKKLIAGMTTRQGGKGKSPFYSYNMASYTEDNKNIVQENRELLAHDISFPVAQWRAANQVHGNRILKVRKETHVTLDPISLPLIGKADGLYTTDKNLLLVSFYADCVPIFIYVPQKGLVALLHAGWKGTYQQIGTKCIHLLAREEQINPADVHVVIGPSISRDVYEVDERVIQKMKQIVPTNKIPPWRMIKKYRYLLDLKEMNRLLLLSSGVKANNISVSHHCTYQENELFFSYRRDKGRTGRMMTFIGMKDSEERSL